MGAGAGPMEILRVVPRVGPGLPPAQLPQPGEFPRQSGATWPGGRRGVFAHLTAGSPLLSGLIYLRRSWRYKVVGVPGPPRGQWGGGGGLPARSRPPVPPWGRSRTIPPPDGGGGAGAGSPPPLLPRGRRRGGGGEPADAPRGAATRSSKSPAVPRVRPRPPFRPSGAGRAPGPGGSQERQQNGGRDPAVLQPHPPEFLLGARNRRGRRRPGSSRRGGRPKPSPTCTSPRHRRPHPHPGRGRGGRARQPRSRALAAGVPDGLAAGPGRWAREMGARLGAAGSWRAERASGTPRARLGQGERSPGAPQAPPFFAPPGDSCLGPRLPAPSDRGTGRGGVTGRSGVRSSRGAPARHPERPEGAHGGHHFRLPTSGLK